MTQTTPTNEQIDEGLKLAKEYAAASATTDWSMAGEAAKMARTLQALAAQLAAAQGREYELRFELAQTSYHARQAEAAAASVRETALEEAAVQFDRIACPEAAKVCRALKSTPAPVTPPESAEPTSSKAGETR